MNKNNTMTNYVYLLHEREFSKTHENVYKIGMTKKENYVRFNQYPKGQQIVEKTLCENDEKTLCNNDVETMHDNKYSKLLEKIIAIFPDYKNDASFGGTKKHVIIKNENNTYKIYYICDYICDDIIDDIKRCNDKNYKICNNCACECERSYDYECTCGYKNVVKYEDIVNFHEMNESVADRMRYFYMLIEKKILMVDKMYDVNSTTFMKKIIKTKINICIENYEEFKNVHVIAKKWYDNDECFVNKIRKIFNCNMVINNDTYATVYDPQDKEDMFKKFNKLKNFDSFSIDVGTHKYDFIYGIRKINSKFYDSETFLRKYTPYLIRSNKDDDYYILNRDYEYIGLNCKIINEEEKNSHYLFKDGERPWEDKNDYVKYCNKYKKTLLSNSLKKCLNNHKFSSFILSSLI
jgi:hypothetical protein